MNILKIAVIAALTSTASAYGASTGSSSAKSNCQAHLGGTLSATKEVKAANAAGAVFNKGKTQNSTTPAKANR